MYGYIIASTALGVVTTHVDDNYIIVDSVSPFLLKEMLLKDIKEYIEKSESGQKEFNENIFEKVKKLFEK